MKEEVERIRDKKDEVVPVLQEAVDKIPSDIKDQIKKIDWPWWFQLAVNLLIQYIDINEALFPSTQLGC